VLDGNGELLFDQNPFFAQFAVSQCMIFAAVRIQDLLKRLVWISLCMSAMCFGAIRIFIAKYNIDNEKFGEISKELPYPVLMIIFLLLVSICYFIAKSIDEQLHSSVDNIRRSFKEQEHVYRILDALNVAVLEIDSENNRISFCNQAGNELLVKFF
jgi:hypothetical protein